MKRRLTIRLTLSERQIYELLLEIARKKNGGRVSMSQVVREVIFGNVLQVHFTKEELSILPYPPGNLAAYCGKRKVLHHPSAPNVLIFWKGEEK